MPASRDLRTILDKIIRERNPLAAAVTSAAFLDGILEAAILSKLKSHETKDKRELFGSTAPLHDFIPKVNLGCALSLYGPRCREDMKAIGDIRNAFAHSRTHLTFQTRQIVQITLRISLTDRILGVETEQNGMTPRNRYMQAVRIYTMALANRHKLERSPSLRSFARIMTE